MDLTAEELRNAEIRETRRGYAREEVHVLLTRAATTIDNLESQLRRLEERCTAATASVDGTDIGETLIAAQAAADQTIAEAEVQARQVVSDSETKAHAVVEGATSTARSIRERERHPLETEILDLATRRDALAADADSLEHFAATYHDRISDALEIDLSSLDDSAQDADTWPPTIPRYTSPARSHEHRRDEARNVASAATPALELEPLDG
jgi:cell division septum initiation protein DivIVA